MTPGLDTRIISDVFIHSVMNRKHVLDKSSDRGLHRAHVLRIHIVSILLLVEFFQGKAPSGDAVGKVPPDTGIASSIR